MYMGIDQSLTSSGIWILDKQGNTNHREIINTKKKEDPMDLFNRIITITERIIKLVDEYEIKDVCIEGLGFAANGDATRNLASLQGVIICSLIDTYEDINIEIVPPTSLKKFASGKGNCDKEAMVNALPEEPKQIVDTFLKSKGKYDLADAYFLAKYILEKQTNE